MENDIEIFEGKTFSSLVRDIYVNSSHKKEQINQIVKDLHSMIKDVGGATVVAPMIKDYLDVGVKNDDQLVKLSSVLQRVINGATRGESSSGGEFTLTDEEKEQLYKNVNNEISEIKQTETKISDDLNKISDLSKNNGS